MIGCVKILPHGIKIEYAFHQTLFPHAIKSLCTRLSSEGGWAMLDQAISERWVASEAGSRVTIRFRIMVSPGLVCTGKLVLEYHNIRL